jgi:hypothetical protein
MIGTLIVYLLIDAKIVVISSSISHLSQTILGIAHFLYPIQENSFLFPVQILSTKEIGLLDAPGPAILGLHSSLLEDTTDVPSRKYVLVNADLGYMTIMGLEPLPFAAFEAIAEFHDGIVRSVRQKAPAFPAGRILPIVAALILKILGRCIGKSDEYQPFCEFLVAATSGPVDLGPFGMALMHGTVVAALTQVLLGTTPGSELARAAMWPPLFDPLFYATVKWPPPGRGELAQLPVCQTRPPRFSVRAAPPAKRGTTRRSKSVIFFEGFTDIK